RLVEREIEVCWRWGVVQPPARRFGQQVREDEPADPLQRARRGAGAARPCRAREMRHFLSQVAEEGVIDVRLAARDQRSQLGEVDDVQRTLAEDRELDGTARRVRHGWPVIYQGQPTRRKRGRWGGEC